MTYHRQSILILILILFNFCSCGSGTKDNEITPEISNFAKGADVSWITQMESSGKKFYNVSGVEMEGMSLLKSLGINAVRLRVWVNPSDGWCNMQDLLVKAKRAKNLNIK